MQRYSRYENEMNTIREKVNESEQKTKPIKGYYGMKMKKLEKKLNDNEEENSEIYRKMELLKFKVANEGLFRELQKYKRVSEVLVQKLQKYEKINLAEELEKVM